METVFGYLNKGESLQKDVEYESFTYVMNVIFEGNYKVVESNDTNDDMPVNTYLLENISGERVLINICTAKCIDAECVSYADILFEHLEELEHKKNLVKDYAKRYICPGIVFDLYWKFHLDSLHELANEMYEFERVDIYFAK